MDNRKNGVVMCQPIFINKLDAMLKDVNKAADLLGVSKSNFYKMVNADEVKLVYELAAKYIVEERQCDKKEKPVVMVVVLETNQVPMFETFLRGMNLKATKL